MKNKEKSKAKLTKKQKRRILIAICVGALVLAACYTVFLAPLLQEEKWIFKETAVERGSLVVGVTESGQLEYGVHSVVYDLDLAIDSEEEEDEEEEETTQHYLKIQELNVASGQRIQEGDALITFSQDSIEDVRKRLSSALADARVEYRTAQSDYDLAALEAQLDYDTQVMAKEYASDIYTNAKSAVANEITALELELTQRRNNVANLEAAVDEAQESFNEVETTYLAAKNDMEQGDKENINWYQTVLNTYLNAQTRYENSKSALERAKEALESNNQQIISLERQLTTARAKKNLEQMEVEEAYQESVIQGNNAEIIYNAQLESLKDTLEEAQSAEAEAQEQLDAFEAFVGEDGIIYAEQSGIVTEVLYEAGDKLVNQGNILSYAVMEDMTISVDVTQEDVVDLQVGDSVDIRFTAYEDTAFEGTIQEINTTATSENSNTVSYSVLIAVGGQTELLYGGMTADITFVTEKKDDVLYVSKNAIVEQNGKTYVYTKENKDSLQQVETGLSNGVSVEILSGLEEGDTVYIASVVSSLEDAVNEKEDSEGSGMSNMGNGEFSMEDFMNGDMEMPEGFPEGMEFPGGDMQMPDMGDMQFPGGGSMQAPGGDRGQGRRENP